MKGRDRLKPQELTGPPDFPFTQQHQAGTNSWPFTVMPGLHRDTLVSRHTVSKEESHSEKRHRLAGLHCVLIGRFHATATDQCSLSQANTSMNPTSTDKINHPVEIQNQRESWGLVFGTR